MRSILGTAIALGVCSLACGSTAPSDPAPEAAQGEQDAAAAGASYPVPPRADAGADAGACPKPKPSISQGLAGLVYDGCDTSDCRSGPSSWWSVGVFKQLPKAGALNAATAIAKPDAKGLYQLALPAGPYVLCAGQNEQPGMLLAVGACIDVYVGTGVGAYDYMSGPGGGGWFASRSDCKIGGLRLPDARPSP